MSGDHVISREHIATSMLLLAANAHWGAAGWATRLAAVACGRHRVIDHLGCRNRIAVWRGVPYLWWIGEVA